MKDPKKPSSYTITVDSETELLLLEQAKAVIQETRRVARNAPAGYVLDRAEAAVIVAGREFVRKTLEATLQEEAKEREKKRDCPKCKKPMRHRGYANKTVVTSTGEVTLRRRNCECVPCHQSERSADTQLGIASHYSLGARRCATLAGTMWSFEIASKHIYEFCGINLSTNTIRKLCQEEAVVMEKWHRTDESVSKEFSESHGEVEFMTDGTCVNTMGGWRVMNVALFSRRELAAPALPNQWESRHLPKPHKLWAFAGIEKYEPFRRHWKLRAKFLKVNVPELSIVSDGAHCIWEAALLEFGKVKETLDIYHALEHISDCGKELYDAKSEEFKKWRDETTLELLESGYEPIEQRLNLLIAEDQLSEGHKLSDSQKEAIRLLRGYLEYHRNRLDYRERLDSGLAIGSGQIEGACKNLIGRRLKQTGARWRVQRVNRMAALCSVLYCHNWDNYWKNQAK